MRIGRGVARVVSLYERAPARQLLDLDPIGALDWIVVAAARRAVTAWGPRGAATVLAGPEVSSGWRGNLVFCAFWIGVAAGAVAAFA